MTVMVAGQDSLPVSLDLVADFVNDLVDSSWLVEHGLLAPSATVTRGDLERGRELQGALLQIALANADEPADLTRAGRVLDGQATRSGLAVRFGPGARLEPQADGVDGALGRLLAAVAGAMADGSWRRFKACREETCRWVFVDRARNRSRHWCSMEVCGNRAKARAFRARQGGLAASG
jgi:predicted RNA-binding Zn ribbon-like protein